ncbi:hypothetical protein [Rhodococcus gannanensis]|uniref:CorA-like Mg2+ transporter protein n=1 Tax=Rhodococcus gannanensis TaxID=1960308 RepID=A0ABW4P2Z5_9NOCA
MDTTSDDHILAIAENHDFGDAQFGIEPCKDSCPASHAKLMTVRAAASPPLVVHIATIESCHHRTLVTTEQHITGPNSSQQSTKSNQSTDICDAVKKSLARCSRNKRFDTFQSDIRRWFYEDLDINLNETIRVPYHNALQWGTKPHTTDLLLQLHPLITSRAALIDVYAIARTATDDEVTANIVRSASDRVEAALMSLTVWQTAILERATQHLAAVTDQKEKQERERDRRIADLGAVTLFPMLLFAFLGSNVLPSAEFPFDLPGIPALSISIMAAFAIALGGRAWVRRWSNSEVSEREGQD